MKSLEKQLVCILGLCKSENTLKQKLQNKKQIAGPTKHRMELQVTTRDIYANIDAFFNPNSNSSPNSKPNPNSNPNLSPYNL